MIAWLFFPTVGLATEDGTLAGLSKRVEILDQARGKAAAELAAKEQEGTVTSRDREHYRTVSAFLEQQIADSCRQLIDKGGVTSVIELPCPDSVAVPEKIEGNKTVDTSRDKAPEKQQEKEVESEAKQPPPASASPAALPPEAVSLKTEKAEQADVLQQPPAPGFFASIRHWWESLFAPKPPPVATGSETAPPREQNENTAAEEKNTQQPDDPTRQQAEQGDASGDKDSAADTNNQGLSDTSADMERASSGEKGGGRKQVVENGTQQTTGQEKGTAGDNSNAAGFDQTTQNGEQAEGSENTTAEGAAAQKAANREKGGSGGPENRPGNLSSGTVKIRTADVGKGGKEQGAGQKAGTGQQVPVQPVGQSMTEKGKSQAASVGSGSAGKKKTGRGGQAGSESIPVADAEVAKLEKSLNDALGEFDGKLLSEQERLAARIPKQREGSAVGSGGYGAEGSPGPAGGGGIAAGGYEGSEGEEGDGRAGTGSHGQPGSVTAGGGKPAPAGGRSTIGTDDDIVARQLREAAEKETDPALKEKLWQEYRKYKQGGG